MAARYRKYFQQCKLIPCNGRPSKSYCPGDRPKRSSGEYKTCGTWCIEFFDDNKEWQSLTFKDIRNKTEAEKRLALFISDRERGQLNLPKKKHIPTLEEYSQRYLEMYKNAKETTLHNKKRAITILSKYLGVYPLDRITSFIVQKFQIERQEKDGAKSGTINEDISNLRNMLNKAIEEGLISDNPCQKIKKLKVAQVKDRVLSVEEINILLNTLQGKDRLMVMVSLFTGMRLIEVLSLKWQEINFNNSRITFTQGKTGKLITVPLLEPVYSELLQYKSTRPGANVFEDRLITRTIATVASDYFRKLLKQVLKDSAVSFHTLRHTFCSLQQDLGVGANTTRELLGHSSLAMTGRYSHSSMDAKTKAIGVLIDHVFNSKTSILSQTGTA